VLHLTATQVAYTTSHDSNTKNSFQIAVEKEAKAMQFKMLIEIELKNIIREPEHRALRSLIR
jgi:hypothetical protein